MSDRDRMGIHTITLKPWSLAECCAAFSEAKVPAITLWRQSIEQVGVSTAATMIKDAGLRVTSLCRGGFFPAADSSGQQQAIDENKRIIDEAAGVGAAAVVLVCGSIPGQALSESRKQIQEGISAVYDHAKESGIKLSIEPLHPMYAADRSAVTTMSQARKMCEQLNEPGGNLVGIAVDVYHVWFDENLEKEIALSGKNQWLHAFHICDWKVTQQDPLNDRGLMGEGVINIAQIRRWMDQADYAGDIEVEIFSNRHWAKNQDVYFQEICTAYDACM